MVQNKAKKPLLLFALKKYLDRIFRQDFFRTESTYRDKSIPRVFGDLKSPEALLTLS